MKPWSYCEVICVSFILGLNVLVTAEENVAKQLLRYERTSHSYQIVRETLNLLQTLKPPIKVLSAIGDSRVGKSTNLNFIRYFWNGNGWEPFVKAFKTSNTLKACTEGVWVTSIPDHDTGGSVVLLDVEGTDLGSEAVTDHLSLFTAILSSGMALFSNGMIKNHNINFLYRKSRLTDTIWKGKHAKNFPPLKIVLRGNLKSDPGVTLLEYVTKSVLEPQQKNKQEESKMIGNYLTKDRLSVGSVPTVTEPKHLDGISGLAFISDYANAIQSLAQNFRRDFPVKKTASGVEMDGKMLADLSVQLVDSMNKNSWGDLPNSYTALEKDLCTRRYEEFIEPVLRSDSLSTLESSRDAELDRFKRYCTLESEMRKVAEKFDSTIKQKRDELAMKLRAREEEIKSQQVEKRRRELENKQKKEIEERERRLQQQLGLQQEAEERRPIEEQKARQAREAQLLEEQKAKELQEQIAAAKKKNKRKNKEKKVAAAVVVAVLGFPLFSDSQLKENVTALPCSKYNSIGLREVTWVWNEAANRELGLRGTGQGVVAQEVELFYPWAVSIGRKGYRQVNYMALNKMLSTKNWNSF